MPDASGPTRLPFSHPVAGFGDLEDFPKNLKRMLERRGSVCVFASSLKWSKLTPKALKTFADAQNLDLSYHEASESYLLTPNEETPSDSKQPQGRGGDSA